MSRTDIYGELNRIFAEVFRRPIELTPQLTARDVPGWDSFRFISIIMATEARFNITLPPAEIDNLENIEDLVNAVAKQINQPPSG